MTNRTNLLRYLKPVVMSIGFVLLSCNSGPDEDFIIELEVPSKKTSSEPSLHTSADGRVYLSWIETSDNMLSSLKVSHLQDNYSWSEPTTIATGDNWFVNWADFPSLTSFGDNIAAHYLSKSADGTYTYDVHLKISNDKGQT